MQIYPAEIAAGLSEQLKADTSLSYISPVISLSESSVKASLDADLAFFLQKQSEKAVSSELDSDLYSCRSILVTCGWNKNDDVFLPEEIWMSRHTPIHKPDNIGHAEAEIVGHMISLYVMDNEGNVIPDNTPLGNLPDIFHIVTNSVIYKNWTDEKLITRTNELIADIESGEMFVSCEALFRGFNYALIGPDGEHHLLARNEETSFLTKHLRRYKGTGEYEGYKVGRALSNITFSGKGYVKKPANPDSIILLPDSKNFAKAEFVKNLGVLTSCREKSKSNLEIDMSSEINTKLEEQLVAANKEIKELNDKLAKADVAKLQASIADLTKSGEDSVKKCTELSAELTTVRASVEKLTKENESLASDNETLKKESEAVKAESLKISRISAMVSAGVPNDEATKTAEKYISLNDELFAGIHELTVKTFKTAADEAEAAKAKQEADEKAKAKAKSADDKKKTCEEDANADIEDEFDVEVENDAALAGEDEPNEDVKKVRAALEDFFTEVASKNQTKSKRK